MKFNLRSIFPGESGAKKMRVIVDIDESDEENSHSAAIELWLPAEIRKEAFEETKKFLTSCIGAV